MDYSVLYKKQFQNLMLKVRQILIVVFRSGKCPFIRDFRLISFATILVSNYLNTLLYFYSFDPLLKMIPPLHPP